MISHIPNTFNYGSAMMAINLIYYLNIKFNGNVEFYVDTRTEKDLENLRLSTGLNNIKVNSILPDKKKIISAKQDVNLDLNWIGEYCEGITNNYDSFIVLGGDDLSEYYSKEHVVYELFKINRIGNEIPTFLVGQTIGPFTGWREKYAADMLKSVYIFTREYLTFEYLKKDLEVQKVFVSSDLALEDLPGQGEYDTDYLFKRYNINKKQYVTLIPSGLTRVYTENFDYYLENWLGIIEYLINEKNCKVVLLPHVLRPKGSDDRIVIENIVSRISNRYSEMLAYINNDISPLDARQVLGNGIFSISGRMHGAVSTFQMRKPAISLSYSVKYKGVIGGGLGRNDLIVESVGDKKWEDQKIKREVIDKIEYLMTNYDGIVAEIGQYLEKRKLELDNMMDEIHRLIRELHHG